MAIRLLWLPVLLWAGSASFAAEWYAAPNGTPAGQGTRDAPWDIETALAGGQKVAAGDTLYLLGGTYRRRPKEQYEVRLVGTAERPIDVRPGPGERATIDGGLAVMPPSAHVWIRDLEILVSEPNAEKPVEAGSHPESFTRPWGGLNMHGGDRCRYIHLVIHHCRQGISFWTPATNSEVYGCLIYDNGWPGTDRGHGHAIYAQNNEGVKRIVDCIMTGGFSYTMHAYGSSRAFINNYHVEGNIAYNGGTFLIGGGSPSRGIYVARNALHGVPMQLGYGAQNEDCEVRDNVIADAGLTINKFARAVNEGNLVLAPGAARPAGAQVIWRPSQYDPRRAHLAVYNWEKKPQVNAAGGTFLKRGDHYRLMNPKDFYGKPVLEGTYDGRAIALPMEGEFGAWVVLKN